MTKDGKGDRNRAPIQITKKNICMTSKVIGVSPRWHGHSNKDGEHCVDWRLLAAFETSMGYPPLYAGEYEEWASTKRGKEALAAMPEVETNLHYQRRLRDWRKRYPKWWQSMG